MDLTNGLTWTVTVHSCGWGREGDGNGKGAGDDCDCLAGLQKGNGKIARARKAKEMREKQFLK